MLGDPTNTDASEVNGPKESGTGQNPRPSEETETTAKDGKDEVEVMDTQSAGDDKRPAGHESLGGGVGADQDDDPGDYEWTPLLPEREHPVLPDLLGHLLNKAVGLAQGTSSRFDRRRNLVRGFRERKVFSGPKRRR